MNGAGEFVAGDVWKFYIGVVADVAMPVGAAEAGGFYFDYDGVLIRGWDREFFDFERAIELFEVNGAHISSLIAVE